MTEKTKIVIVQNHKKCLEDISKAIGESSKLDLHYTHNPVEALKLTRRNNANILVADELFYGTGEGITPIGFIFPEISRQIVEKSQAMYNGYENGTVLAEEARRCVPDLLTVRYALGSNKHNNGEFYIEVDKADSNGEKILADMLKDSKFLEAVREKNLREIIYGKGVKVYFDNFPDGWK